MYIYICIYVTLQISQLGTINERQTFVTDAGAQAQLRAEKSGTAREKQLEHSLSSFKLS